MSYVNYICAGAVVLVSEKLSVSETQDGLDALLYCQAVASGKVPEFANFERWMNANAGAVRTLGGLVLSEPCIDVPPPRSGRFSLSEMIAPVLSQLALTSTEALQVSLRALSLHASALLQSELLDTPTAQTQQTVRLKCAVISPGVSIAAVVICFRFDEKFTGPVLSYRFAAENVIGNVSIRGYRALMETEDYDLSRETVVSLLGCQRQERIIRLT